MTIITGKGELVREWLKNNTGKTADIIFPENNLDAEEQAQFITKLGLNTEVRIVTFSPWIISDVDEDNVWVVNENLRLERVNFKTFGASVNKINMKLFRRSTLGDLSNSELNRMTDELMLITTKDEADRYSSIIDIKFGESVEKILALKSFFDKFK